MKNKKILALILAMVLVLGACTTGKNNEEVDKPNENGSVEEKPSEKPGEEDFTADEKEIKKLVEKLFTQVKTGKFENVEQYIKFDENLDDDDLYDDDFEEIGLSKEETDSLFAKMMTHLEYSIDDLTINGDEASINFKSTNKDFQLVVDKIEAKKEELFEQKINDDDYVIKNNSDFLASFEKAIADTPETIEKEGKLIAKKVDGSWLISMREDDNFEDFIDLLLPNFELAWDKFEDKLD